MKKKIQRIIQVLKKLIKKYPFRAFAVSLTALFLLIVLSNILRDKKKEIPKIIPIKQVSVFNIGTSPKLKILAKIKKENIINIVAQTSGVVQKIYVQDGSIVNRGKTLAYTSTNYAGSSASSLQRQIAEKQYQNSNDNLSTQIDLIKQQKELAEKSHINNDELSEVSNRAVSNIEDQIEFSEETLEWIEAQIEALQSVPGSDAELAPLIQYKLSLMSGITQSKSTLRQLRYGSDDNKPPMELSAMQRDLTLKQLDLQEKTIYFGNEVSKLQYQLAKVAESLSYPSSFSAGVVEKVHVKLGQIVNPGTKLFTISGSDKLITATILTSKEIAQKASKIEPTVFYINNERVELTPTYISTEATNNLSYSIKYAIPAKYGNYLTDGQNLEIELAIGMPNTSAAIPFLPIDSIYQTENKAFVFVNNNNVAKNQEVELGGVHGRFVEIISGLDSTSNQIILNRTVIEGDQIEIVN